MVEADVMKFRESIRNKDKDSLIDIAVENFRKCGELSARLEEYKNADHEFFLQFAEMKDRLAGAEREIETLRRQNEHLTGIRYSQAQEMYGRSSERTKDIQPDQTDGAGYTDPLDEDAPWEAPEKKEDKTARGNRDSCHSGRANGKKKGKKEEDLSGLPVCHVYEYDIDELDRKYGQDNWRFAFWEAHDMVEVQKQYSYRKITYTPVISSGLEHCMEAVPYEGRIIPKSIVSSSLLAMLLEDLYGMHLPLYRQENDTDRFGFPLSRQTMSNWICYAGEHHLMPVYEYLCGLLKAFPYQQCDETTYHVITETEHRTNYIWIHRTSEKADTYPIIIYCYEASRSADHLFRFFDGISGHISLTSDAYAAYYSLEQAFPENVTVCGCLMHARRRFVDSIRCMGGNIPEDGLREHPGMAAIGIIAEIYAEEGKLSGLSAQERQKRRQSDVRPLVDKFFDHIHSLDGGDPSYNDKLKDAICYSVNQETALRQFLSDGNIPIDNGATERNVKPVACHRNNSMFSYSEKGARTTAAVMSLVETAKANGAVPYLYLKYLLEKMSQGVIYNHPYQIEEMVPWSDAYRSYESDQRTRLFSRAAPPGNERPRTPKKTDRNGQAA